jgi:hypothetical protein
MKPHLTWKSTLHNFCKIHICIFRGSSNIHPDPYFYMSCQILPCYKHTDLSCIFSAFVTVSRDKVTERGTPTILLFVKSLFPSVFSYKASMLYPIFGYFSACLAARYLNINSNTDANVAPGQKTTALSYLPPNTFGLGGLQSASKTWVQSWLHMSHEGFWI